jgi:tetratricopeptide (TPR) repeat protein
MVGKVKYSRMTPRAANRLVDLLCGKRQAANLQTPKNVYKRVIAPIILGQAVHPKASELSNLLNREIRRTKLFLLILDAIEKNKHDPSGIWADAAAAFAKPGNLDKALEFVRKISSPEDRSRSRVKIAGPVQAKNFDKIIEIPRGKGRILNDKLEELTNAAAVLAQSGRKKEANRCLDAIFVLVREKIRNRYLRSRSLANAAAVFAQLDRNTEALYCWDRELTIIRRKIKNLQRKADILASHSPTSDIAIRRHWNRERYVSGRIRTLNSRKSKVSAEIAITLAKLGEFNEALEIAEGLNSPDDKLRALANIAAVLLSKDPQVITAGRTNLVKWEAQTIATPL